MVDMAILFFLVMVGLFTGWFTAIIYLVIKNLL
jgi:hypothetical protein